MNNIIYTLKDKHLGKIFLIILGITIAVMCNYITYTELFCTQTVHEYGTVLAKNDMLSTGKYPRQKFILSFKYDNPKLGTQDIETDFSTWTRLKPGDRTAFIKDVYHYGVFTQIVSFIIAGLADFCVILGIFVLLVGIFEAIWEF